MSLLLVVISPVFLLSNTPAERVLSSLQKQIHSPREVLSSRRPWPRQLPHPCAKHSQLSLCQPGSFHQPKATDQRASSFPCPHSSGLTRAINVSRKSPNTIPQSQTCIIRDIHWKEFTAVLFFNYNVVCQMEI